MWGGIIATEKEKKVGGFAAKEIKKILEARRKKKNVRICRRRGPLGKRNGRQCGKVGGDVGDEEKTPLTRQNVNRARRKGESGDGDAVSVVIFGKISCGASGRGRVGGERVWFEQGGKGPKKKKHKLVQRIFPQKRILGTTEQPSPQTK